MFECQSKMARFAVRKRRWTKQLITPWLALTKCRKYLFWNKCSEGANIKTLSICSAMNRMLSALAKIRSKIERGTAKTRLQVDTPAFPFLRSCVVDFRFHQTNDVFHSSHDHSPLCTRQLVSISSYQRSLSMQLAVRKLSHCPHM